RRPCRGATLAMVHRAIAVGHAPTRALGVVCAVAGGSGRSRGSGPAAGDVPPYRAPSIVAPLHPISHPSTCRALICVACPTLGRLSPRPTNRRGRRGVIRPSTRRRLPPRLDAAPPTQRHSVVRVGHRE